MNKCENESESSIESMNGSWVKLDASRNENSLQTSPKISDGEEMEVLLADAVQEQMRHSRCPLIESANEESSIKHDQKSDWVQAWASRPEQRPAKILKQTKQSSKHQKSPNLSIRRTKVMKSSAELLGAHISSVLPMLVFSHVITLGIGLYLGKKWTSEITK